MPGGVRFYPDLPARRTATMARDLAALLLVLAFAWIGVQVHDAVNELSVLGRGVEQAGGSVESGFGSAADALDGAPVIGTAVGTALRDAGRGTGGEVAAAGRSGVESVEKLANLLGLLTGGLPALVLLARVVPDRVREVRRLTAASRLLRSPGDPERRRLIAMRAAFSLPYGELLRHTRDPLGDLAAGRYDALVAAEMAQAGLRER